jgi:hypothetical protein
MFKIRRLLIILLFLALLASAWIWWNRPHKVDMAAYVPSDSLAYFEANDLPATIKGMTETTAWKALAPSTGIRSDLGEVGWLSKIAAWTGIGTAEAVVFSRAQIAVAVVGISGTNTEEALQIKPRYALVVETHSSESRALAVVEKRIGSFAQRAYGNPKVERKAANAATWITWSAPSGGRKIIAVISGSVAIIGNDEEAVLKCLSASRKEITSLSGNTDLQVMRSRFGDNDSVAFGFITQQGSERLFQTLGMVYARQASDDPRAVNIATNILPQLTKKLCGPIGWISRFSNGLVEDRYFLSVPNDVTTRLSAGFVPSPNIKLKAAQFLPNDAYSLTLYNNRSPQAAWRALNLAIAAPLDVVGAATVPLILNAALRPYGIEDSESFFRAIGPEIYTVRLNDQGSNTVTIVSIQDEPSIREFVKKKLGTQTPITERVGDATLLISPGPKRSAVSIVEGYLLMGNAEHVRLCLRAYTSKSSLDTTTPFQKSVDIAVNAASVNAVTITDDTVSARSLMALFATIRFAREKEPNPSEFEKAIKQLPYSVTETRLVETGFERKTLSPFGQFGNLAVQYGTK